MKKEKHQKIPSNPVCKECGFPIARYQKYLIRDKDGTILCEGCFKELKKIGMIK